MVKDLASSHDVEIVGIIDPYVQGVLDVISQESLNNAAVCIDFSSPDAVLQNCTKLAENHLNIVIGTTGWEKDFQSVASLTDRFGIGILYGSNFSLGMNAFYRIIRYAAKLMNQIPEYDVYGYEMHHNQKKDSPSGTAKELSNILLAGIERKTRTQFEMVNRKIDEDELHFASIRAGFIPGTHMVGFDSNADTIELTHRVRNRTGLALGALKGAMWLKDKKGLYKFSDVFEDILKQ